MKNILITALVIALCGCDKISIESPERQTVNVTLGGSPWSETIGETRALSADVPTPVFALVAKEDNSDWAVIQEVTDDNFAMSLPKGGYDIFVVAGLAKAALPKVVDAAVSVSTDAMVGHEAVTVKDGMGDVEITASHILSKVSVTVNNIPDGVEQGAVWMRNARQSYTLDSGWSGSGWTKVSEGYLNPGGDMVVIEFSDAYDNHWHKALELTSAISAGEDMEVSVLYEQLQEFSNGMTWEDWNQTADGGTLAPYTFKVGDTYLSYPATIIKAEDDHMAVFSHSPITMTAAEIKAISNPSDLDLDCDIPVSRWTLPGGSAAATALFNMLQNECPLATLNSRIKAAGGAEIRVTDKDVVAALYNGTLFRYDFENCKTVQVKSSEEAGNWRVYPIGIINFAQ